MEGAILSLFNSLPWVTIAASVSNPCLTSELMLLIILLPCLCLISSHPVLTIQKLEYGDATDFFSLSDLHYCLC